MFADGTRDIVAEMATLHRMVGECGPVFTDAALSFVRVKGGKVNKAFIGRGSRLVFNGKTLIRKKDYGTFELQGR